MRPLQMRLGAACAAAIALSAGGAAADGPPLADKVPAGPLLYLGWAGTQSLPAEAAKSRVAQLFDEPEMQRFGAGFEQALFRAMSGGGRASDKDLADDIRAMAKLIRRQPTALIVDSLTLKRRDAIPTLALLVADEQGKFAAAFAKFADAVIPAGERKKASAHGVDYAEVPAGRENLVMAWGTAAKTFFVALGGDLTKRMIGVLTGKGEDAGRTLAADPEFRLVFDKLNAPKAPLALYVDGAGVRRMVAAIAGDAVGEDNPAGRAAAAVAAAAVMGRLGLTELGGIGGVMDFAGADTRHAVFVHTTGPRKGLLALFEGPAVTDKTLAAVPADSNGFAAVNFDWAGFYDVLVGTLSLLPRGPGQELDRAVADLAEHSKVSVPRDILGSLGPATLLINTPRFSGDGFLAPALVVEVKKPLKLARAEADLSAFIEKSLDDERRQARGGRFFRIGGRLESHTVASRTVRYVDFGGAGFAPIPFAPSWCLTGDRLVIGFHPQTVIGLVRHIEHKGKPITESPEFKASRAALPAAANSLVWGNLPATYPYTSTLILFVGNAMFSMFERGDAFHFDPADFPAPDVVGRYTHPTISVLTAGADGLLYESRGTLPFLLDSPQIIGPLPGIMGFYGLGVIWLFMVF